MYNLTVSRKHGLYLHLKGVSFFLVSRERFLKEKYEKQINFSYPILFAFGFFLTKLKKNQKRSLDAREKVSPPLVFF